MVIRTHFEDKNVFSHCMPSKVTMSSHISKTKMSLVIACLQKATMTFIYISKTKMSSIIACLQRQQCPHLHFEDDNVFKHCMPSKATISSSTFRRRQCLQSLHAFKRRQCLHLHFEDENVFTSKKLQYPFPLCFVGLDVLCLYAFKKKGSEDENENENELNEKRRNLNIFMPSRVLLLGFTLVAGLVKIQLKQN